ncbi:hypothetical protein BH18ACI3_BH18ACI3_20810 [soil metagenome]
MRTLQTFLFTVYFCLMLIVLGGTIFSVMVEYPNWFANVPESLAATRSFYKVLHPGYFFQTFGPLMLLAGVAFVIAGWRMAETRNLVTVSILIMIGMELLTFLYIYPRLDLMFGPHAESQSVDALRLAADQFTTADTIRTVLMFTASGFGIAALFRFFRHRYSQHDLKVS